MSHLHGQLSCRELQILSNHNALLELHQRQPRLQIKDIIIENKSQITYMLDNAGAKKMPGEGKEAKMTTPLWSKP
jgi:hypothetical protein